MTVQEAIEKGLRKRLHQDATYYSLPSSASGDDLARCRRIRKPGQFKKRKSPESGSPADTRDGLSSRPAMGEKGPVTE